MPPPSGIIPCKLLDQVSRRAYGYGLAEAYACWWRAAAVRRVVLAGGTPVPDDETAELEDDGVELAIGVLV